MVCDKENMVIITTTKPKQATSEKRRNNLINNFSTYNIPIIFNDYVTKTLIPHQTAFEMISNHLKLFIRLSSTFKYAIICEDDFFPISNFIEELNTTVRLLPENWRCLHLCPGYAWGRRWRDKSKIGKLNPEYNMNGFDFHESGRFYINCDKDEYYRRSLWVGGPIAMLVNNNYAQLILDEFTEMYKRNALNSDVLLVQMLKCNDYICREPQLGYEEEEGGTTFLK
jgi:hypothetical protein